MTPWGAEPEPSAVSRDLPVVGFSQPSWEGPQPLTHFPPLYSVLLAVLIKAGLHQFEAARWLNVRGSGNPAVHMRANSSTSIHDRNSRGYGIRKGSGSRYRSRLGTLTSGTRASSSG